MNELLNIFLITEFTYYQKSGKKLRLAIENILN